MKILFNDESNKILQYFEVASYKYKYFNILILIKCLVKFNLLYKLLFEIIFSLNFFKTIHKFCSQKTKNKEK